MERVACSLAGLLPQIELEARPFAPEWRQHRGEQERGNSGDDAHPKLAMKRLAVRARHFRELFGLAENADRLVGDLLSERSETHHATGPLDQSHVEQSLQLTKAGRERRLRHEAGFSRLPEVAVLPQRH